jgi:hypothetical protein
VKKILLLSATVFAFSAAIAQVSIIPKAGFTLATQRFEKMRSADDQTIKIIRGFTAGIGFNVPVGKNKLFSIQPELVYIQKGYLAEYYAGIASTTISHHLLNYLEMPVLGQVRFGTAQIKVVATAGPSLAYGLNGRYAHSNTNELFSDYSERVRFRKAPANASPDVRYLDPAYFNRLDLGVQAGLGIGLAAGRGVLQLEARYGHGLTHFFKGNDDNYRPYDDHPNYWNRAAAFTLGYAIPLKGKQ